MRRRITVKVTSENTMADDPAWMNPENDRKTPYTDEELDEFVEGFIRGLDEAEWLALKSRFGEDEARKKIRDGFIANDEYNLINLQPIGGIH
jgi:hypothetical protein